MSWTPEPSAQQRWQARATASVADDASAPPPTRPLTMPEWEARWAEQQTPVRTPVRIRNPREALEKQHLMGRLHRIEREGAHDDGDDVAGPSTKPKAVGTTDMDEFTSIFARAMAESDSSPEPASPSSPDETEPHDPGSMLADLALVDAVWERRSMIPERRDARGATKIPVADEDDDDAPVAPAAPAAPADRWGAPMVEPAARVDITDAASKAVVGPRAMDAIAGKLERLLRDAAEGEPLEPFESLPLHFAAKGRPLYEAWDFKPLAPPPPMPSAVIAGVLDVRAHGMDGITNVINVAPRETEPDDPLRFDVVGDRFGDVARADAAERRRNGERRAKVNYLGTVAKVLTSEMDDMLENLRRREANAYREISEEEAAFQRRHAEAKEAIGSWHEQVVISWDADMRAEFDGIVRDACEAVMDDMMEELRWRFGRDIRSAALKIQSCFRGWKARRQAKIRRKGLAAGLAYLRNTALYVRFGFWRHNAAAMRRSRLMLEAADKRRVFARRHKVFLGWRDAARKDKAFRLQCEELGRAMAYRRVAPAFREWRGAARRAVRQRVTAVRLLLSVERRRVAWAFRTWSHNAAGCARARVLDTRAHAVASRAAAAAVELAERKATEAWEAAKESSSKASCGRFKEARELAAAAKALAAESEAAEREAAEQARRAGPSLGADGKRAWAAYGAVHGASARAAAAAAAANAASEFKAAAKAYCNRILLRKVFRAWAEYSEWLKPLRAKAGRALSLFKNNSVGRTFYAWMDYAKEERARREVDAVRAYMDIHQGLISKHIRRGRAPLGEKVNVASSARRGAYGSFVGEKRPAKSTGAPSNAADRAERRRVAAAAAGKSARRRAAGFEDGDVGDGRGGGSWVAGGVDAWVATTARITDRSRM